MVSTNDVILESNNKMQYQSSSRCRCLGDLRPEVQVDEDEELEVPSEPPPLCIRGNLLARARTVTEELITVNVDAGFAFKRLVVFFF